MEKGAFKQTMLSGAAYVDWVAKNEQLHRELMKEAASSPSEGFRAGA